MKVIDLCPDFFENTWGFFSLFIIHYFLMIDKWWCNPIQWHCIFVDLLFKLYFSYKMGWVRCWLPLVVAIVDLWLKVPPVTGWSRLGKCVKETVSSFFSFFLNDIYLNNEHFRAVAFQACGRWTQIYNFHSRGLNKILPDLFFHELFKLFHAFWKAQPLQARDVWQESCYDLQQL